MITENLSTLKIHKLTQKQYDRELSAGNIDENALYLTPDEVNGNFVVNEDGTIISPYIDALIARISTLETKVEALEAQNISSTNA